MTELIPLNWGNGWFKLTPEDIKKYVENGIYGCYILARLHGGIIVETRSGRSENLYRRLFDHCYDGKYAVFRFEYVYSEDELYICECERYHALKGVIGLGHGERIHPSHVSGADETCPICDR